jgi:hypothetical protein
MMRCHQANPVPGLTRDLHAHPRRLWNDEAPDQVRGGHPTQTKGQTP